jgi:UDP-4-amino-4,6-dideoxy-N-acetyl-beta-L-altrosamine transaminase
MLPYGRQSISQADIDSVVEVLHSDWLTQGPAIERFEATVAGHCNVKHAVAVSSGTAALHVACLAHGLGPGGLLWTSPNTFVASANCGRYCGADVDFVDIDPRTYNMSVEALAAKLEEAESVGRLPDLVVPVHFAGQSCDMAAMADLAKRYGFIILEDACHAIGGSYRGMPVGSCEHSSMAVFSFHPVKVVTTGEGGMILTNDDALAERLRLFRNHGITRDEARMQGESHGGWYYQQTELGYNYRMTDIQAALGVSQMSRLGEFVSRRRELASRYDLLLEGMPLTRPWQYPDAASAWHLYVVRIPSEGGRSRRDVYDSMREAGIGVQIHYIPVPTQPYYRALGFAPGDFPEAEAYYAETLTLPLFPAMTEEDQDKVANALRRAMGAG